MEPCVLPGKAEEDFPEVSFQLDRSNEYLGQNAMGVWGGGLGYLWGAS